MKKSKYFEKPKPVPGSQSLTLLREIDSKTPRCLNSNHSLRQSVTLAASLVLPAQTPQSPRGPVSPEIQHLDLRSEPNLFLPRGSARLSVRMSAVTTRPRRHAAAGQTSDPIVSIGREARRLERAVFPPVFQGPATVRTNTLAHPAGSPSRPLDPGVFVALDRHHALERLRQRTPVVARRPGGYRVCCLSPARRAVWVVRRRNPCRLRYWMLVPRPGCSIPLRAAGSATAARVPGADPSARPT